MTTLVHPVRSFEEIYRALRFEVSMYLDAYEYPCKGVYILESTATAMWNISPPSFARYPWYKAPMNQEEVEVGTLTLVDQYHVDTLDTIRVFAGQAIHQDQVDIIWKSGTRNRWPLFPPGVAVKSRYEREDLV